MTDLGAARGDRTPPGAERATDWRLVPAAVGVWLAAFLGLVLAWWWLPLCAVFTAVLGVAVGLRARDRPYVVAGWLLVATSLGTALLLGGRVQHAATHPLRAEAAVFAPATLRVELDARPQPLYSAGFGGQQGGLRSVLVTAEVLDASVEGRRVATDGEVLLIAPAQRWATLLTGQRVTATGTLAAPRGTDMTVAVLRVYDPPERVSGASWWQRGAESVRAGLRAASRSVLAPAPAGLLPGLVDGDTSALPHDVAEEFKAAGLSHLVAVSGTNLAIVAGAVLLVLRALRVGPRTSAVGAGVALVGFVVLAGPEPSVLRAAVMGAVGLLAVATGRERAALPALSTAVIVLVLHDPGIAVSIGFLLSVLATAALVVLAPRWSGGMARAGVPVGIAKALAVPAAAHLVTAPVIAGFAGQVSLVAIVANLVAAPVVAPVTVLGLLAALVSTCWSWGAELLVRCAGPLVSWLVTVADVAAGIPGAVLAWPSGASGGALLAVVVLVLVCALRVPRLRVLLLAVLAGALVALVPIRLISPGWPPTGWAMVDCDVGQGDAEVLSTGTPGRAVVVDAGPEPEPMDACLSRLGVTNIPLVVLSHLHADHIGGLAAVLDDRSVGAIAVGHARSPDWAWDQVRREAAGARVPLVQLDRGQHVEWPGLTMDVLGPTPGTEYPLGDPESGTSINNTSLVLRAGTPAGRILLAGDVELLAQEELLTSGTDLTADVLKIPHHGSRYSLPQFLDAVHARVAVASVGAGNSYGHPSPLTMSRLRTDGALTLRTDTDGDIAVLPGQDGPRVVRSGPRRVTP